MFTPFHGHLDRKTQNVAAKSFGSGRRRTRRRRPDLEALENRNLLSFIGSEQLVSTRSHDNTSSDNASSSNGTSVAVWVNTFNSADHDIWAQRFDQYGRLTGTPIQVDFLASDNSFDPHVSMDGFGRFVVTWENHNSNGTENIMMRYFSASGSPITGIIQVSNLGSTDFNPDVAASNGSFVISWTHRLSATDFDIDAERFVISSAGVPVGRGIFGVNTDTNVEDHSSVAMSPNGSFDIAYERQFRSGSSDWDIYAQQYNGFGNFVRKVAVNTDTNAEHNPSVSMNDSGNAMIAYQEFVSPDYGIYANELSSLGSLSPRITIRDVGGVNEVNPSVALDSPGFVVAYDTPSGVQVTTHLLSDTQTVTGFTPAVSVSYGGRYLVTYTRFSSSSGHFDIFSQRGVLMYRL